MKILVLNQYFYPEGFRINDLALGLKAQGHEVQVLTAQPNYPAGKIFPGYSNWSRWTDQYEGIPVFRVPIFPRGAGGAIRLILNYLSFVFAAVLCGIPRLRLKRFDYTLVFATSPITSVLPAIVYKWLTGTPVCVWVQDLWPDVIQSVGMIKNPIALRIVGLIVGFIYRQSDLLLIPAESSRENLTTWGGKNLNIVYLPNWAETFYQPQPIKNTPGEFAILFAGNLGKAQDLDTILAAAEFTKSENAKIQWHFIGDGTLAPWLKDEIIRRQLNNVRVFPRRPEIEMPEVFSNASALLVTLKKDPLLNLVLPSKVQSYLASGKPILAAGDGEISRVVQESGAGRCGPPQDPVALARNAILLSQSSVEELKAYSDNGRTYYLRHFGRSIIIDKLIQVLQTK